MTQQRWSSARVNILFEPFPEPGRFIDTLIDPARHAGPLWA